MGECGGGGQSSLAHFFTSSSLPLISFPMESTSCSSFTISLRAFQRFCLTLKSTGTSLHHTGSAFFAWYKAQFSQHRCYVHVKTDIRLKLYSLAQKPVQYPFTELKLPALLTLSLKKTNQNKTGNSKDSNHVAFSYVGIICLRL